MLFINVKKNSTKTEPAKTAFHWASRARIKMVIRKKHLNCLIESQVPLDCIVSNFSRLWMRQEEGREGAV